MFTGLVEGLGVVTQLVPEAAGLRVTIAPPAEMLSAADPCRLGDSIALNGCCLTVVDLSPRPRPGGEGQGEGASASIESQLAEAWTFQAGEETLSKTNLGRLKLGDAVNLERSLPATGRLGGHFVLGHVDGVGTVDRIDQNGEWVTMTFRVPKSLGDLMVSKGSVAVDGVSLTLVVVEPERFSVALIPHTLAVTTLGRRAVGDAVNIETDVLGKYVRKFVLA
ncbi:MAG: riboflavin synthase [Planctomycetaceae bacterium]